MSVDYVDFVVHDRVTFLRNGSLGAPRAGAMDAHDAGPTLFTVTCEYSTLKGDPVPLAQNAAAYLPAGTPVHSVRGYLPSCRLAAQVHGQWMAYLAQHEVNRVSQTQPCALAPVPHR